MLSQWLIFHKSKNFTSDSGILAPPTAPINHYLIPRNQQNRNQVLFHYAMLIYSRLKACFEHSNFLKVTFPNRKGSMKNQNKLELRARSKVQFHKKRPKINALKFDYERFSCSNMKIRYWSWNYRGCWHQTCPPIAYR